MRPHLLVPGIFTFALGLAAGGFSPGVTGALAACLALALAARIALASSPFAGASGATAAVAAALAALLAWTLLSIAWSGAPFRAVAEVDRTLAYALAVVLLGSFAARDGDLGRLLGWVAAAVALLAAVALALRLVPDLVGASAGETPRLTSPLPYWNAAGVLFAVGIVLALHCTASPSRPPAARVAAAAALPVLAVALLLTFSRGGLAAAALGCGAYLLLGGRRELVPALAAVAPPTAVAVWVAYGQDALATTPAAPGGGTVAAVTVACALAAPALRAAALRLEPGLPPLPRPSRRVTIAAAVVLAVVAVAGTGGLADRVFRTGPIDASADQRDRFGELGVNGRVEHWRVSLDAFADAPLTGSGAGTYRLEWERERPVDYEVDDGHGLYTETLGELGVPGLVLVLVALAVPLAVAARRLAGPERDAHAAFLAAAAALLVHAGIDWDWEVPAVFLWLPAAAGVVCARRASRAPRAPLPAGARVAGVAVALALAVAPAAVALSEQRLDTARDAAARMDCATATEAADGALRVLPFRPEPRALRAACAVRAGRPDAAARDLRAALDEDPENWRYAYGLAVALALGDGDPRPAAGLALRLNPREQVAAELAARMGAGGPPAWARAAAATNVPAP